MEDVADVSCAGCRVLSTKVARAEALLKHEEAADAWSCASGEKPMHPKATAFEWRVRLRHPFSPARGADETNNPMFGSEVCTWVGPNRWPLSGLCPSRFIA